MNTTDESKNVTPDPAGDLASNLSEADLSRIWLDHYNQRTWSDDEWRTTPAPASRRPRSLASTKARCSSPATKSSASQSCPDGTQTS